MTVKTSYHLRPVLLCERRWALSPVDIALKNMYVGMVCLFDGSIDVRRFVGASEAAIEICDFWCGTLVQRAEDHFVECNSDRAGSRFVPISVASIPDALDLEDGPTLFDNALLARLLPVDRNGQHRPLLEMQLTTSPNATALGVVWNHAISDLRGIYAMVELVSRIYNGGEVTSASAPTFDRSEIWAKLALEANGPDATMVRHSRNRSIVVSRRLATLAISRYLYDAIVNCIPVCVFVEGDAIESMAEQVRGAVRLSPNDILNGTLLKMFGQCAENLEGRSKVGLYFPIDVRPLLGASPHTVANCLGNVSGAVELSFTREASILELASESRRFVSEYGVEQLAEDMRWAEYWRRRGAGPRLYHRWLFGKARVYSSNWSAFELRELRFGDAKFHSVLRSSRFKWSLPFPAFHSTILPLRRSGSDLSVIRTTITRSGLPRLREGFRQWPHIATAVRLDTMDRIV
jgi:hypothetical protein